MKLDDYDITDVPQELIDILDDIKLIINYGKVQTSVTSSVPNWAGRRGERAFYMNGSDGREYVCSVDGQVSWKMVSSFNLA